MVHAPSFHGSRASAQVPLKSSRIALSPRSFAQAFRSKSPRGVLILTSNYVNLVLVVFSNAPTMYLHSWQALIRRKQSFGFRHRSPAQGPRIILSYLWKKKGPRITTSPQRKPKRRKGKHLSSSRRQRPLSAVLGRSGKVCRQVFHVSSGWVHVGPCPCRSLCLFFDVQVKVQVFVCLCHAMP